MGVLCARRSAGVAGVGPPGRLAGRAAYRGLTLEVFFPSGKGAASRFEDAKAICAGCPVVADCRAMADWAERGLPRSYVFGVFAGESPLERIRRHAGHADRVEFMG
jgi:hypothetical protein